MRGQSSLELMLIVALGIAMIAAFFAFSYSNSDEATRISQGRDSVARLARFCS